MTAYLVPGLHWLKERKVLPGMVLLGLSMFCLSYCYCYATNRLGASGYLKEEAVETAGAQPFMKTVYSLEIQSRGQTALYPLRWQNPPLRRAFPAHWTTFLLSGGLLAACYLVNTWALLRRRGRP